MLRYYLGKGLQLLGLVITAEALIMNFGKMGPMMRTAAIGIGAFYLGRLIEAGFRR